MVSSTTASRRNGARGAAAERRRGTVSATAGRRTSPYRTDDLSTADDRYGAIPCERRAKGAARKKGS